MAKTDCCSGRSDQRDCAGVLIVDDHPMVRRGFRLVLEGASDLKVCGEAGKASEAFVLARDSAADIALIDIRLGDMNGLELVKQLRMLAPSMKMLVVSAYDECVFAERALRSGAAGYISKSEPQQQLLEAIRKVLDGGVYLSPAMRERMLRGLSEEKPEGDDAEVAGLTDRELEVLLEIAEGLTTAEIAAKLYLSSKTIETYRQNLKRKLNLRNNSGLVCYATRCRLERGQVAT